MNEGTTPEDWSPKKVRHKDIEARWTKKTSSVNPRGRRGFERAQMQLRVVGFAVRPGAPDHAQPSAGQDPNCMGMVTAAGACGA